TTEPNSASPVPAQCSSSTPKDVVTDGLVTVRALTHRDAATIAAWGEDAEFVRGAGWSHRSTEERQAFWASLIAAPPADLIRLGIDHDGELIGYVDLHGLDPSRRELGFALRRASWGHGLGTAAAAAAVSYGFTVLALDLVW